MKNKPRALTGNSFYNVIGGLICEVCREDTNLCKCPKTESEAKQLAQKNGGEKKKVKKDIIKNIDNFKKITERLNVMARSQPLHKYALVLGLKSLKNVVEKQEMELMMLQLYQNQMLDLQCFQELILQKKHQI